MPQNPLRIIPLGGLGEIGKNIMALEYKRDIIIIDAGVLFPEEDMLGVDLVIPNIAYLISKKERIRGIFITHGHEDHTGALPYLLPHINVPVYAPRLAYGLIQVKLKEHKLLQETILREIEPGKAIKAGAFRVEFFRVCHSIPDAMGLAITTPLGMVIHTGDFKIDHTPTDGNLTDLTHIAHLCERGVLLLMSDSTYADVPGFTPSEHVVGVALEQVIANSPGRVMIATFASLISRIQQIVDAAANHGRMVSVVGRSMVNNVKMALEMGYITDPNQVLVPISKLKKFPLNKSVVITTGSQGEPTSALVRISNRDHRDIEIIPGDTVVVSATPIPGNEIGVSRAIDNLYRQGARVLHDKVALVHVHGHASREELKIMLNLTRPRFFVPVHGQYRHLVAHAELAQDLGVLSENTFILEDGDVLELNAKKGRVVEKVPSGNIYVDGPQSWDIGSGVLTDRRTMSQRGILVVTIAVGKTTGKVMGKPRLVASGFIDVNAYPDLLDRAAQIATYAIDYNHTEGQENPLSIAKKVEEAVGNFIYQETHLRPMIIPVSVEV